MVEDVDAAGGVPSRPVTDPLAGEGVHHCFDDLFPAEEQVVDESERPHVELVTQQGHFLDDVVWFTDSDGDVGVGADRGAAERAVVGAAAGADHVGLPAPGLEVRILAQVCAVDERQRVDIRREVVVLTGDAAGDRCFQDRVQPHHPGQPCAVAVIVEQFDYSGFGFPDHQGGAAAHPGVGEDRCRHRLGLVTAEHEKYVGI
ncbi:hypothetical protein PWJ90_37020 [Nocardia gipuzkoensis]|nr:hypothetical protein [Nocardia gipuzkoensis]MDE1675208.1 hypothetical protein [Nocardia gipuzkoensis]